MSYLWKVLFIVSTEPISYMSRAAPMVNINQHHVWVGV
jgi:hypothetical protein